MAAQNHTVNSRRFARFLFFLGITLIFSLLAGTGYSANLTVAWDANNEPACIFGRHANHRWWRYGRRSLAEKTGHRDRGQGGEEQSRDVETNHTTEVIGYMVFEAQNPTLVWEVEDGDLFGAFEFGSDPAASGGQYVHVPNGIGTRFSGPDEKHKITFSFEIPKDGTYRIKAAVHAANGNDNSFWVKVNDAAGVYLWDALQNTSYEQDYVNDRNGADPVEVWLPAGVNTVTVYLREDGTRLDRIELEPVAAVP